MSSPLVGFSIFQTSAPDQVSKQWWPQQAGESDREYENECRGRLLPDSSLASAVALLDAHSLTVTHPCLPESACRMDRRGFESDRECERQRVDLSNERGRRIRQISKPRTPSTTLLTPMHFDSHSPARVPAACCDACCRLAMLLFHRRTMCSGARELFAAYCALLALLLNASAVIRAVRCMAWLVVSLVGSA